MQSLFPNRPQQPGPQQGGPLIAFNAGKCTISALNQSGKVTVTAEKRKGKISFERGVDGLMHFKWTDRTSNNCEDDVIVFPGDIQFKRVTAGKPEDRVYSLKVINSTIKRLYWLQDKSSEKDKENVDKLIEFANNPPAAGSTTLLKL